MIEYYDKNNILIQTIKHNFINLNENDLQKLIKLFDNLFSIFM